MQGRVVRVVLDGVSLCSISCIQVGRCGRHAWKSGWNICMLMLIDMMWCNFHAVADVQHWRHDVGDMTFFG
jgi:hypothetical protein